MKLRWLFLTILLVLIASAGLADGASARTSDFRRRTTPVPQSPSAPIQESPANGATDLPTTVTVRWTLSKPGETYRVQISHNSTFTSLVLDAQVMNATGYTVFGLSQNTVYYWRVNASAGGQISSWSPIWNFQTTNRVTPAAPTLVSPEDGATGLPETPTLVWNVVAGADSYDFQIAQEPSFSGADIQWYGYVGTSVTVMNLVEESWGGTHFYWRVRARNTAGLSPWSEVRDFTIVSPY